MNFTLQLHKNFLCTSINISNTTKIFKNKCFSFAHIFKKFDM